MNPALFLLLAALWFGAALCLGVVIGSGIRIADEQAADTTDTDRLDVRI